MIQKINYKQLRDITNQKGDGKLDNIFFPGSFAFECPFAVPDKAID
jgi:hypothetical protein